MSNQSFLKGGFKALGDWDDKEFVITQITQNGFSLQHASNRLKDDKEVVIAAVSQNGYSFQYASTRLKNDFDVAIVAVSDAGAVIRDVPKTIINKKIVLAAVKECGNSLSYVPKQFQNDKEVVLAAIKEDILNLQWASNELKGDINFCIECVKASKNKDNNFVFMKGAAAKLFKQCGGDVFKVEQKLANDTLLAKIKKQETMPQQLFKRSLNV